MKPFPETQINEGIADAIELLAAAKLKLTAALSYAQHKCEHRFVSEVPWSPSQQPHRICNHCRLIEPGTSHSGGSIWSKHDRSKSDLGNVEGRIVLPVANDVFWKMRVSA